jgi:hypothetical protein
LFILIDHISFRRCCHYLNDQSHQRNDIGPRSTLYITTKEHKLNFERIASMHPYFIYLTQDIDPSMNVIWSRITSLRHLCLGYYCDASKLLITQTGLTSLDIRKYSPLVRYCTNLLSLAIPLTSLSDYGNLPTSLTKLQLRLNEETPWSFDDENIIRMNNHFPHLVALELTIEGGAPQFSKAGALSSLSRWSSLTKLIIGTDSDTELPSLEGLLHTGM